MSGPAIPAEDVQRMVEAITSWPHGTLALDLGGYGEEGWVEGCEPLDDADLTSLATHIIATLQAGVR